MGTVIPLPGHNTLRKPPASYSPGSLPEKSCAEVIFLAAVKEHGFSPRREPPIVHQKPDQHSAQNTLPALIAGDTMDYTGSNTQAEIPYQNVVVLKDWRKQQEPRSGLESSVTFSRFNQYYASANQEYACSTDSRTEADITEDNTDNALGTLKQGRINPSTIPTIAGSGLLYACADALSYVKKSNLQMPLIEAIYDKRFDKDASAAEYACCALAFVEHPIMQKPLIDTILAGKGYWVAEAALPLVKNGVYKNGAYIKRLQSFLRKKKKVNNQILGPSPRR
ncbi:TPA: hypothetical protein HA372_00740 [Candidatus Woesearchaeota archaeon]|nr:hypothetical protein [Candidatus Woesearchaeota archaeon]